MGQLDYFEAQFEAENQPATIDRYECETRVLMYLHVDVLTGARDRNWMECSDAHLSIAKKVLDLVSRKPEPDIWVLELRGLVGKLAGDFVASAYTDRIRALSDHALECAADDGGDFAEVAP